MSLHTILIAIGCFVAGFGAALSLVDSKSGQTEVARKPIGVSEIVDAGPFTGIERLPRFRYGHIHWLESRTRFNNNGMVIMSHEMFVAAMGQIDRLLRDCEIPDGEAVTVPHNFNHIDASAFDVLPNFERTHRD